MYLYVQTPLITSFFFGYRHEIVKKGKMYTSRIHLNH